MVDLPSDTIAKLTPAMLQSVLHAHTGDNVFGKDPDRLELEGYVVNQMRKEKVLFVPMGTMPNLLGMLSHCHRHASCEVQLDRWLKELDWNMSYGGTAY